MGRTVNMTNVEKTTWRSVRNNARVRGFETRYSMSEEGKGERWGHQQCCLPDAKSEVWRRGSPNYEHQIEVRFRPTRDFQYLFNVGD